MKKIIAFERNEKKKELKKFFVFFLSFLIILFFLFCYFIAFRSQNIQINEVGQVVLGDDLFVRMEGYGASSNVVSFSGAVLVKGEQNQNAYFVVQKNCFARFKVFMSNENGWQNFLDVKSNSNWNFNSMDNYFYSSNYFNKDTIIKLFDKIIFNENYLTNKNYDIQIVVETLPVDVNIQQIWNWVFEV